MESLVMAQADSCRPLTAEVWVRSQVSPSEICGAQSGTVTGFSPSSSVSPCQYYSTYSFIYLSATLCGVSS